MRLYTYLACALTTLCALTSVHAHDAKVGAISIDHPYATPTPPAARTGAIYFRNLKNTGEQGDRLIAAHSPAAEGIEVHEMQMDGDVMRMRGLPALELPPHTAMPMRHAGGRYHLMLTGLKQPLRAGDRFPLTLDFERSGSKEVMVWVQQPRASTPDAEAHTHHH